MIAAAPSPAPAVTRRRALALGARGVASVAGLTGLTGLVSTGCSTVPPSSAAPAGESPAGRDAASGETAKVVRRGLEERASFDGTLGFGPTASLAAARPGTVTKVPEVGATMDRGAELWRVDGEPVTLFLGTTPLWRELSVASPANADVGVLKQNLRALGHYDGLLFTDDDTFDPATAVAVRRWQGALGLTATGAVPLGAAVVVAAPVRVAEVDAVVGAPAQGTVLTVTGTASVVTVQLDVAKRAQLPVGAHVRVRLPGGRSVPGSVTAVGRSASDGSGNSAPGGDSTPKVRVTVALDEPADGGDLEEAPVKVEVVTASSKAVLAVPVGALVALREGGLAVERPGRGYVAVTAGRYADGWVEVSGSLVEGDDVVTTR